MTSPDLLTGSEALARGAAAAGVSFACGFAGAPVDDILDAFRGLRGPDAVQHATNEKVAVEVALGLSHGGRRVLAAVRTSGLNIAADPIVAAAYAGVGGGLVIACIDDPGLLTSLQEQDSRHFARIAKLPMLAPSDVREIGAFVPLAIRMSERYDVPVLLRLTTRLCITAGLGDAEEADGAEEAPVPAAAVDAPPRSPFRDGTQRHAFLEKQLAAIEAFGNQAFELNTVDVGSPDVGIVTSGMAYNAAKEVLPEASFLKLGLIHPLPHKLIAYFASLVRRLYAIEELDPFFEEQIRALGIEVTGKTAFPQTGELDPDTVASGLAGEGVPSVPHNGAGVPLPARTSTLCLSCAHRGLMNVFQRLDLDIVGDIGCYRAGDVPPADPAELDACYCIGASMSVAYGLALAQGVGRSGRTVAVMSGSTFMHSGFPALANIVRNGGDSTVCILAAPSHDDGTARAPELDYRKLCEGVGVASIRSVDPRDEDGIERALREELARKGVSVLVSEFPS